MRRCGKHPRADSSKARINKLTIVRNSEGQGKCSGLFAAYIVKMKLLNGNGSYNMLEVLK
jgi:hypothetical protein